MDKYQQDSKFYFLSLKKKKQDSANSSFWKLKLFQNLKTTHMNLHQNHLDSKNFHITPQNKPNPKIQTKSGQKNTQKFSDQLTISQNESTKHIRMIKKTFQQTTGNAKTQEIKKTATKKKSNRQN